MSKKKPHPKPEIPFDPTGNPHPPSPQPTPCEPEPPRYESGLRDEPERTIEELKEYQRQRGEMQ